MNLDEFAFVNQQLGAMVREGIPLEGALRKICESMARGALRTELEALAADLANGMPLADALAKRNLPPLYVRLLQVGAKSGDLPGTLTALADYYQQLHSIWGRLKSVLIYPFIVLVGCLGLSTFIAYVSMRWRSEQLDIFHDLLNGEQLPALTNGMLRFGPVFLWTPVVVLFALTVLVAIASASAALQQRLRWRLPGWREASLWQLASMMAFLLRGGCHLDEALELVAALESGSAAGPDLQRWRERLAGGEGRFASFAAGSRVVPPLFIWLVGMESGDLAAGFARAAQIYHGRATQRSETLLYAALPVSVLLLGGFILGQALTFAMSVLSYFMPLICIN